MGQWFLGQAIAAVHSRNWLFGQLSLEQIRRRIWRVNRFCCRHGRNNAILQFALLRHVAPACLTRYIGVIATAAFEASP